MPGEVQTKYNVRKGAAWITLNRPEARNALSAVLINEVYDHLATANADENVRAIVITRNGRSFCAGADLRNLPEQTIEGQVPVVTYPVLLNAITKNPKPVVAAVNGAAYAGGLGLVGAADIAITIDTVQMSFSEVRIGVIPTIISVVCIPKLDAHHAMKLFLNGERFDGNQAADMGLVHRAVPEADLRNAVEEVLDMINLGGPNALREAKRLVQEVSNLSVKDGFERTEAWSMRLFESEEGAEGMSAFRERRMPKWVTEE